MWTNSEMRADARFHLSTGWADAIVVSLILTILASTIAGVLNFFVGIGNLLLHSFREAQPDSSLDVVWYVALNGGLALLLLIGSGALAVFLTAPLGVSVQHWFIRNRETPRAPSLNMVFRHFKENYKPLVIGRLWESFWLFLWGLLVAGGGIIGALVLIFLIEETPADGNRVGYNVIGVLLLLLVIIIFSFPLINRTLAYALNPFILADNPEIGYRRSLNLSKAMMRGNKLHYLGLQLSFIGWGLLAILTCGIGYLFLTPYINQTNAEVYSRIRSVAVGQGLTTMEELGFVRTTSPSN